MQESFSIISPAGFTMDIGFSAPQNGTGTYGQVTVSQPLPGGAISAIGTGDHSVTPGSISGKQGTLSVNFTTGASGSARAVAFIAASSNLILGIAVDSSNRPYALLVDVSGNIVGQSSPGNALTSGTPVTALLAWNSQNVVASGLFAGFDFGELIEFWGTNPVHSWTSFAPTSLYVGTSLGGHSLSDFNGTIGKVQVSDVVTFTPPVGASVATSLGVLCDGTSNMNATLIRTYAGASSMAGAASIVPTVGVVYAGVSSMVGSSSIVANLSGGT